MRSYYAHLETTIPFTGTIAPRPVYRSSAIFPVMHSSLSSSRILFMGYWILKRNVREVAAIVTLRNNEGKILARHSFSVTEAKTYRIEVADLLEMCPPATENDFFGSMEIEFFSTQNLVFPFPAVVINYYSPKFSTVVHTAQRIYNDFEDMTKNSQTNVPESGFNIYADNDREPFLGIINGIIPVKNSMLRLQFFNHKQEILERKVDLGEVNPYQTQWIYPARCFELKQFLDHQPGTCKVHFHVNWIFPRLLVGNLHHSIPAVTITHTYYDCSQAETDSDYWKSAHTNFYPSTLMVPACIANHHYTNIYFYPIYSPSSFSIDVELYDDQGLLLATKKNALIISSQEPQFHRIPIRSYYHDFGIPETLNGGVRLIARPIDSTRFPARIKLGLDIGIQGFQTPCNICTNLQPYNPALETKPSSFRWAPILADNDSATIWIMNSAPEIVYQRTATIEITFFREIDSTTLKRNLNLPANGFIVLHIHEDPELRKFFNNQVGWMTVITSNPYTSMYYFAENSSGVVGGDHGF
ncbi:MAG: hypothetical protein H0X29_08185 [Parachlamydiaceae bacterium]|nr:hypothetical protein [Parachlamydiaceae bacterium]